MNLLKTLYYLMAITKTITFEKPFTSLFDDLQKYRKIKEFNTGKCNQDFVENFFSRILSGVWNRVNPPASELSSEFLKIYINELFTKIEGSNCELDPGDFLIKVDKMKINIPAKTLTST